MGHYRAERPRALIRAKVLSAGARSFARRVVPPVATKAAIFDSLLRGEYRDIRDWILREGAARSIENLPAPARIADRIQRDLGGTIVILGIQSAGEAARRLRLLVRERASRRRAFVAGSGPLRFPRRKAAAPITAHADFLVPADDLAASMRAQSQRFAQRISTSLWEEMRDRISQDLLDQKGTQDIEKTILDLFDGVRANSYTVARTEVAGAVTQAQVAVYREAGVKRKSWLSLRDPPIVRVTHLRADVESAGEGIPWDQPFSNGLRWPLDENGAPGEVINCRCSLLPREVGEDEGVFEDLASSGERLLAETEELYAA